MIDVSIIIPTYKRMDKVRRVLRRINELPWPQPSKLQVIVVQNGPSYQIEARKMLAPEMNVVELYEPRLGKTRAQNMGLSKAEGELLLLMDDDVLLDDSVPLAIYEDVPQWRDVGLFGGPLRPLWAGERPRWYSAQLKVVTGEHYFGETVREYPPAKNPVGALRLFRSRVFEKHGIFEVNDGLCGKQRRGVPGSRFFREFMALEERMYLPRFSGGHIVEPFQMTRRYYLKHGFLWGRGLAHQKRNDVLAGREISKKAKSVGGMKELSAELAKMLDIRKQTMGRTYRICKIAGFIWQSWLDGFGQFRKFSR